MKGGVAITERWRNDAEGALFFFIRNCKKARILTDDSISCVTYIFEDFDNSNGESPYITVRSTNLNEPLHQILFKVGFVTKQIRNLSHCRRRDPNIGFESITYEDFEEEVQTQNKLFQRSFIDNFSPFEPICPAIICYTSSISKDNKQIIFNNILLGNQELSNQTGILTERYTHGYSDRDITKNLLKVQENMFFVVMEFMDGYQPLHNLIRNKHKRAKYFEDMHKYELIRMYESFHKYHCDNHYGNVLINPNYSYFTDNKYDNYYGRAIIIDFGRIKPKFSECAPYWITPGHQQRFIQDPVVTNKLKEMRIKMAVKTLKILPNPKIDIYYKMLINTKVDIDLLSKNISEFHFKYSPKDNFYQKVLKIGEKISGLATKFFIALNGTLPSQSIVYNDFNLWNWSEIFSLRGFYDTDPNNEHSPKNQKNTFHTQENTSIESNNPKSMQSKIQSKIHSKKESKERPLTVPSKCNEFVMHTEDDACKNKVIKISDIQSLSSNLTKKDYQKLSLKVHPDKNTNPPCSANGELCAKEKFQILNNKWQESINHPNNLNDTHNIHETQAFFHSYREKQKQQKEDQDYYNNTTKGAQETKGYQSHISPQSHTSSLHSSPMDVEEPDENQFFNLLYTEYNTLGNKMIADITKDYEKVVKIITNILELESQILDDIDNKNITLGKIESLNRSVIEDKKIIDVLKGQITQKTFELKQYMLGQKHKSSGIIFQFGTPAQIDAFLIHRFQQYIVYIESILSKIYTAEQKIDEALYKSKQSKQSNIKQDTQHIHTYFNIPNTWSSPDNTSTDNETNSSNSPVYMDVEDNESIDSRKTSPMDISPISSGGDKTATHIQLMQVPPVFGLRKAVLDFNEPINNRLQLNRNINPELFSVILQGLIAEPARIHSKRVGGTRKTRKKYNRRDTKKKR